MFDLVKMVDKPRKGRKKGCVGNKGFVRGERMTRVCPSCNKEFKCLVSLPRKFCGMVCFKRFRVEGKG